MWTAVRQLGDRSTWEASWPLCCGHRRDPGHRRHRHRARGQILLGIVLVVVGLLVGPAGSASSHEEVRAEPRFSSVVICDMLEHIRVGGFAPPLRTPVGSITVDASVRFMGHRYIHLLVARFTYALSDQQEQAEQSRAFPALLSTAAGAGAIPSSRETRLGARRACPWLATVNAVAPGGSAGPGPAAQPGVATARGNRSDDTRIRSRRHP